MTHNPTHKPAGIQESINPHKQTSPCISIHEQVAKTSLNTEGISSQHDTSTHYFDEFWRVDDEDPFLLHKEASQRSSLPSTSREQENSPSSAPKTNGVDSSFFFQEEVTPEETNTLAEPEEETAEYLTLEMELPSDFFEDSFEVTDDFVSSLLGLTAERPFQQELISFEDSEMVDVFDEEWADWNETSSSTENVDSEELLFDEEEEFYFLDDTQEDTVVEELEEYISLSHRNQQLFFSMCWELGCDEKEWEVLLPALEDSGNIRAAFQRLYDLHTTYSLDVQELGVIVTMRHYAQAEFEVALTYEQCALLLQGRQSLLCEEEVFELLDTAFFSWKRSQGRTGNYLEGYSFFEHCQQFRHLEEMDALQSHPAIVDKSLEMTFEKEDCFSNYELDMSLQVDSFSMESQLCLSQACREDRFSLNGQTIEWNPGEWW